MFEYSKAIMDKIRNKEDLSQSELMVIERSLRLDEVNEEILDYQLNYQGIDIDNRYDLTERMS